MFIGTDLLCIISSMNVFNLITLFEIGCDCFAPFTSASRSHTHNTGRENYEIRCRRCSSSSLTWMSYKWFRKRNIIFTIVIKWYTFHDNRNDVRARETCSHFAPTAAHEMRVVNENSVVGRSALTEMICRMNWIWNTYALIKFHH